MLSTKSPIYQTAQIRELERLAIEQFGISGEELMERAGAFAFNFLMHRFPKARKIGICCGNGNNGGDGYVLARLLKESGLDITIWQVGDKSPSTKESKRALNLCLAANIPILPLDEHAQLGSADLWVDAICGIGIRGTLRPYVVTAIEKMAETKAPVFAIDVPSGLNVDTGEILGSAVCATATITFIGLKLGLLTGEGVSFTGDLAFSDLQLPPVLFSTVPPVAETIELETFANYLKPRPRNWHKGLSGHVLIVGGDLGYSGAPCLAAMAALRVGSGLLTVATRAEHAPMINLTHPEIMCRGVSSNQDLEELVAKADVIVLGPGLGQSKWSLMLWNYIIQKNKPLVLDADGLNLLAKSPMNKDHWVLTPHPGEASRLLKVSTVSIQEDRLSAVKAIVDRYGGVCVLKGAGTIVSAQKRLPALSDKGNPGMATAGMGDVLSGVIGGLMAQGIPPFDAAKLGVLLHALAGDMAAKDGERGMIATDLMPYLRRLSNR